MKKTLLLIAAVLLLTACTQEAETNIQADEPIVEQEAVTENIKSYTIEELNISFDYPADWEQNELKTKDKVQFVSPKRDDINYRAAVIIPGQSFEEFETENKQYIEEKYISVKDNYPTDADKYPSKEYTEHGGVRYLIEIDDNYVEVLSEDPPDEKQKQGLDVILNSISF